MNVLGIATIYLILLFTYRSFAAGVYMHLGIYWLPFLLTAILLSVLVVVLVPQRTAGRHDEADIEREVEVGLGLFFWVLIVGLIAVVLTAYR